MINVFVNSLYFFNLPPYEGGSGRVQKKEGRLTTTIFTNLKSYTMKNTLQR